MKLVLTALALATALTAPAFADAMSKDMTCSAFTGMNADGMKAAMSDAMKAGDAMASGEAKADGAMASGDAMGSGDAMASGDAMMSPEDSMAALVKTCTEHPDMMLMDAMHAMK